MNQQSQSKHETSSKSLKIKKEPNQPEYEDKPALNTQSTEKYLMLRKGNYATS